MRPDDVLLEIFDFYADRAVDEAVDEAVIEAINEGDHDDEDIRLFKKRIIEG